jgi:mannose-1-phosphate guanylyltransferase
VVILAGGEGRRLYRLTRDGDGQSIPKQYCSLNGGASLLQLALRRAMAVTTREHIVCVVNEAHRRWWGPQFIGFRGVVVVQPANRGTGFGVLLPLLVISKTDARGGVLCLPSDHYVEQEDVMAESLRQATAQEVYDSGKITLLGFSPHAPDPGFGYVLSAADSGVGMRPVRRFAEKPDGVTAEDLVRGGALWNGGVFSAGIARLIELFPRSARGMMLDLASVVESWSDTRRPSPELCALFARYPRLDFSSDVLQRQPENLQLLAMPPCGWSDVGTPERLAKALWSLKAHSARDIAAIPARTFNLANAFDRAGLDDWSPRTANAGAAKP